MLPSIHHTEGLYIYGSHEMTIRGIKAVCQRSWVPTLILCDMAREQTSQDIKLFCNMVGITLHVLVIQFLPKHPSSYPDGQGSKAMEVSYLFNQGLAQEAHKIPLQSKIGPDRDHTVLG